MAYTFQDKWPTVSRDASDIEKLYGKSPIGLDLEWNSNDEPTIIGLSDGVTSVSVPFYSGLSYFKELLSRYPDTKLVGHNVIGADMFVLAQHGIHLKLEQMEDTIVLHYLTSPHLCKSSGKGSLAEEGGSADRRGRGFMNLGTMCSLWTDLPFWKDCRGFECEGSGTPCDVHDKFGYNGTDSLGPVLALPGLKRTAMLRGVDKLYDLHKELMYILAEVRDYGVRIDVPYVEQLRDEFTEEKEAIAKDLPFNPDSPKQVMDYFKAKGVKLENAQEETVRDLVEELDEDAPDELIALLDYKEIGNGPDRWFKPRERDPKTGWWIGFVDHAGFVHPNQSPFTSSSRLACSNPNFHNVAKRRLSRKQCVCEHARKDHAEIDGVLKCMRCACQCFKGYPIGKKIRRAIIAPEEYYIVRGDYSNAENRNFLYRAGYEPPNTDLHKWMVDIIGLKESDEFAVRLGGARDASKSVTHAVDYGEGLQLKEPSALKTPKIRKEIDEGARVVFWNWTFKGKVVTFTGINLARRAFGEATLENRRKANEISSKYIDQTFPKIRELQKQIFKQVEVEAAVRLPMGYCTLSYGKDEDRLKTALAIHGSGPIAHCLKLAIVNSWRSMLEGRPQRLFLSVHDEVLTYTNKRTSPQEAIGWLKEAMDVVVPEMPGFRVPSECSYGPNWRDQTKEGKL